MLLVTITESNPSRIKSGLSSRPLLHSCNQRSHGRSVLPRERTEILHLSVTPAEWLSSKRRSIHRLFLNYLHGVSGCLGTDSSLRICDRTLPWKDIFSRAKRHTHGLKSLGIIEALLLDRSQKRRALPLSKLSYSGSHPRRP